MSRQKEKIKKTVFFIVEGNTDKTALEKIFKAIYKHRDIRFEFTNGDVTSDDLIDKTNVCDILYKKVKKYMDENKLKKTDIWKIIQILIQMEHIFQKQQLLMGNHQSLYIQQQVLLVKI